MSEIDYSKSNTGFPKSCTTSIQFANIIFESTEKLETPVQVPITFFDLLKMSLKQKNKSVGSVSV